MFEPIPECAEKVLEEVLSHTDDDYWKTRFSSALSDEEQELREAFSILKQRNLVEAKWYDNYPAIRIIKTAGKTYFDDKAEYIKEQKKARRKERFHGLIDLANLLKP